MELESIESKVARLLHLSLQEKLNDADAAELDALMTAHPELYDYMATRLSDEVLQEDLSVVQNIDMASYDANVGRRMPWSGKKSHYVRMRIYLAAASLVMLVGLATWFWRVDRHNNIANLPSKPSATTRQDVPPGGNKAVLTLADGKHIILDSAGNGLVSTQGASSVVKTSNGQLAYQPVAGGNMKTEVLYNTLVTPVAGQYQVTLPDGTKVWLNNASSLRYPTSFTGKERVVEISGEAYFEVAKNEAMPFRVDVVTPGKQQQVEVLGTGFNITAYPDEAQVRTTLVQGSIKVKDHTSAVLLRPGFQAQSDGQTPIKIHEADTRLVTAWKNGFFNYAGADIQTVMRQLGRWYGIEVRYEGNIPERSFSGRIGRNLNLSQVLIVLENNGIHFRIDGRKVIVTP